MGKKFVIAAFLGCMALAILVFSTRDVRSLRENIEKSKEPRVLMEDFTVLRYEEARVVAKLTAKSGQFFEPNQLELEGDVRGDRAVKDGVETIGSEAASVIFKALSLGKMMTDRSEVERAELTGFVEVGVKEHLLTTDYAEYANADGTVRSQRPVRVEGPNRVFTGDEGFVYGMKNETLEMSGQVRGVMKLED